MDCALYAGGRRLHRLDDLHVAVREAEKEDGFVWIGLHDPTAEEFDAIAEAFTLPALAIEDAIASHQRPKLERYGDLTFAVVKPVLLRRPRRGGRGQRAGDLRRANGS